MQVVVSVSVVVVFIIVALKYVLINECLKRDTDHVQVLIIDTAPELTIYKLKHIAPVRRHFSKGRLTQQKLKTTKNAAPLY